MIGLRGAGGSSLGITMGHGLDSLGSNPSRGKIFLFSTVSRLALGAHLAFCQLGDGGGFFPGDKAAGPGS
jgi:hypothetical protein